MNRFSRVRLFATLWTVAHQAPLSMGFSRQEYYGLPCSLPRDLPNPGIKPTSPMSPALAGGFFTTSGTGEAQGDGGGRPNKRTDFMFSPALKYKFYFITLKVLLFLNFQSI